MNTRPTPYAPAYTNALLLATREDMAAVDKRALREAGIRTVRVGSSGLEAARELAIAAQNNDIQLQSCVILCNEQLSDMTGEAFVRLTRLHPLLLPFPIIVAVSNDTPSARRTAVNSGYSGLLPRPYTLNQLLEQLERAEECRSATSAAMAQADKSDTSAFEIALKRLTDTLGPDAQSADQLFREGMLCLRQRQWDAGISLLQRTLKINPCHADAVLALAAAWRGKGNEAKSRVMLREAVAVLADIGSWEKAMATSTRLMQEDPTMQNPLLEEAGRLVVSGNFIGAAKAVEAARKMGSTPNLFENLARACTATPDPKQAVKTLGRLLAESGDTAFEDLLQAQWQIHLQNFGSNASAGKNAPEAVIMLPLQAGADEKKPFWKQKKHPKKIQKPRVSSSGLAIEPIKEPEASPMLDGFPLLRDAWAVARITASLFRHLK